MKGSLRRQDVFFVSFDMSARVLSFFLSIGKGSLSHLSCHISLNLSSHLSCCERVATRARRLGRVSCHVSCYVSCHISFHLSCPIEKGRYDGKLF